VNIMKQTTAKPAQPKKPRKSAYDRAREHARQHRKAFELAKKTS
jgi:hypothetical protein